MAEIERRSTKASAAAGEGRPGPAPRLQPSIQSSRKDKSARRLSPPPAFLSGFHHDFPPTINKLRITRAGRIPGVWMHL